LIVAYAGGVLVLTGDRWTSVYEGHLPVVHANVQMLRGVLAIKTAEDVLLLDSASSGPGTRTVRSLREELMIPPNWTTSPGDIGVARGRLWATMLSINGPIVTFIDTPDAAARVVFGLDPTSARAIFSGRTLADDGTVALFFGNDRISEFRNGRILPLVKLANQTQQPIHGGGATITLVPNRVVAVAPGRYLVATQYQGIYLFERGVTGRLTARALDDLAQYDSLPTHWL
jgi:hypothetical protein